jgi:subtilisin family serine protease
MNSRPSRIGSGVLLVALALVGTMPTAALAADTVPPTLPTSLQHCVGPSPVTASAAPWATRLLAPQAIWPLTRGADVVVAVVDTGVSAGSPALRGSVRAGADVAGGRADSDCTGRGTALAGIVAARPVSGVGFTGMAPGAVILPIRITDENNKITPARLAAGVRAATAARADIILIATGLPTPDTELAAAVRAATDRDALVIAAVGETAAGTRPNPAPAYPAAYPQVLAVNDIDTTGTAEPVPAGARVDLAAPGAQTFSVGPFGPGHYTVTGSGVAAAYVTGAAALVRSYHPDLKQAEVRARLERTARPAPGGERTASMGAGVLDAYAAVTAIVPPRQSDPVPAEPVGIVLPAEPRQPRSTRVALLTVAVTVIATALVLAAGAARGERDKPQEPPRATPEGAAAPARR